jgi:hypothetical protein
LQLALPRFQFTAFSPRVAQLRGGYGAHILDNRCYPGQTFNLAIVVDTSAARAGAAVWQNRQLLGKTRPKPPAARDPSNMTWKSSICPSMDRYIVIGDIAMRLRNVIPLSVYGLNRSGTDGPLLWFVQCRWIGEALLMWAAKLFVTSFGLTRARSRITDNDCDRFRSFRSNDSNASIPF